jgi:hypothetical protein
MMRPNVSENTADMVEQLADQLLEIDADLLNFEQQVIAILKHGDELKFRKAGRVTEQGKIVAQLGKESGISP